MPRHDLVCLGLTILDVLGRPVDELPAGGGVTLIQEIRMTPAGTAAAPAVIAARLGLDVHLVGGVGTDELGEALRRGLALRGVDDSGLQEVPGVHTSATLLPIRPDGERPALHAPGAALGVRIERAGPALLDTRFLHLGGVGALPFVDGAPAAALLAAARSRGITVTCDLIAPGPGTRAALEAVLPYVDWLMPTADEACAISGAADARAAAGFFLERGARGCIFKRGAQGSLLMTADETLRIPAFRVDAVDTTGCGDAYCGGFVAGLARGLPAEEACRFASATAALVATGLGSDAGVVDFESTLEAMTTLPARDASGGA